MTVLMTDDSQREIFQSEAIIMGQWIKAAGLYLNTARDGRKFMTGYLGGMKICIFKNDRKEEGSKDGYDYHLMVTARPEKKQDNGSPAQDTSPVESEEAPF